MFTFTRFRSQKIISASDMLCSFIMPPKIPDLLSVSLHVNHIIPLLPYLSRMTVEVSGGGGAKDASAVHVEVYCMKEFIAMVLHHQNSAWWMIGVGMGVEGRKLDVYKMFHC